MSALRTPAARLPAPDSFPRWFLLSAAALIVLSLLSVAYVRLTGQGPDQRRMSEPTVAERPLRFEDRPDGSIAVVDGRNGDLVASVQGEEGFLRGALRALARERRARGLGPEQPFQLMVRPDGGLTLLDPVTDQRIDLASFGATHAGTFARLMAPAAAARP